MIFILNSGFSCLSVFSALFLLTALIRYIYREKYAENLSKLPSTSKERIVKTDKLFVKVVKILLWFTPFYLIFIPLSSFVYIRETFIVTTIFMTLFVVVILQEYLFRKWIIHYLETHEMPK
jgi:hypothetical protein